MLKVMRIDDRNARESYMMALLSGSARGTAFDVALARWRAHNAGVPEAIARRALIRLLTATVWNVRETPSTFAVAQAAVPSTCATID
jgi:hypothetical protein